MTALSFALSMAALSAAIASVALGILAGSLIADRAPRPARSVRITLTAQVRDYIQPKENRA
ncbi:hypothetical protein [Microbacterium thalli]|uniref:hypothetical protein n=1 Tax=Microbacterium thalli TaxID=3027921 RepID=UPI002365A105|nr:hypothetical protein [Microbacterium thalli]MDD7930087.1 hypothetical protein [Microbacterium thalli]